MIVLIFIPIYIFIYNWPVCVLRFVDEATGSLDQTAYLDWWRLEDVFALHTSKEAKTLK